MAPALMHLEEEREEGGGAHFSSSAVIVQHFPPLQKSLSDETPIIHCHSQPSLASKTQTPPTATQAHVSKQDVRVGLSLGFLLA